MSLRPPSPPRRLPGRLFLALLVLCSVSRLDGAETRKGLTLDLLLHPDKIIEPGLSRIGWRPESHQIIYLREKRSGKETTISLWSQDAESGAERLLLDSKSVKDKLSLASHQWSPRGDRLLVRGENDLWLVDPRTAETRRLTKDPEAELEPTFSPAGDHLAFVKGNNLYDLHLKTGLLEKLTADSNDLVLNGRLDWVYEEELANRRSGRAFEWAPDGTKLAFLRLDDSRIPEYPILDYGPVHPGVSHQRYPLAGDPNPAVSVHVVTVGASETKSWTVSLDPSVEYVLPWFAWTPDSKEVSFATLNRGQNELALHLWDLGSAKDRVLFVEKDRHWINDDFLDPPHFLKDGRRFLWRSERDGWFHLYLFDHDGKLLRQLTRGPWGVEEPVTLDETNGWVHFAATQENPRERRLYRVKLDGTHLEQLSHEPGAHSAELSPDGRYLLEHFSTIDQPPVTRLLRADGAVVKMVDAPTNHLNDYVLARTEFVEVKAADGARLFARLVKPADFDPRKKYPVIVRVYGGPGVQIVRNAWGVTSLQDHLLAQRGYLIWSLDNRGSTGRGHEWETAIFKRLGQRELADQLAGTDYLKSLPCVDAARIGIWGWSYGGYLTLYALTHAPEVFKCGIAGAPVTDWHLYDSIYTERYLRTPQENARGYEDSSPVNAAGKLRAKLLIIHGTADDNVHPQNTMNFIDALIKAGRPYELHLQPGERHGFGAETARRFLDERVVDFLQRNL
ncbi:MAG: S9 family peptidase [Limisphaerales bacterium]